MSNYSIGIKTNVKLNYFLVLCNHMVKEYLYSELGGSNGHGACSDGWSKRHGSTGRISISISGLLFPCSGGEREPHSWGCTPSSATNFTGSGVVRDRINFSSISLIYCCLFISTFMNRECRFSAFFDIFSFIEFFNTEFIWHNSICSGNGISLSASSCTEGLQIFPALFGFIEFEFPLIGLWHFEF